MNNHRFNLLMASCMMGLGNYESNFTNSPEKIKMYDACVEYYKATKDMSNRESQPLSDDLRRLRYHLGLSNREFKNIKQSAERNLKL